MSDKWKYVYFKLDDPLCMIVSDRIDQLKQYYGVSFYKHYTRGRNWDNEIEMHIQNLILTYGQTLFDEMFDLIYNVQANKKVS